MPRESQPFFRKFDGWWYLNVRDEFGRRRKIRLAKGKRNKQQALDEFHKLKARQAEARVAKTIPPRYPGEPIRAIEVVDDFLTHGKQNLSAKTYRGYADFLNDFLEHIGDRLSAVDLKVHHVTSWLDARPGWGSSTKAGAVGAVRRTFRWATEQGIIATYPLFGMKAPKKGTRETILSQTEFEKVIEEASDDRFRDLLTFLWNTGARPQEACAVDASHFQAKHRRIVFPTSQAKGKRAPRVIYLNDAAISVVKRLAEKHTEGPLFRNRFGRRWNADAVRNRFKRLEAKVGVRYCAYNLRHSWGTQALESGVDSITASVLMGHADASQLARTYQHLAKNPDNLIKAARKVR